MRNARFVGECVLRSAEHEQAAFDELEAIAPLRRPFLVARTACEMQIAQQRRGASDVLVGARAPELPAPVEQRGARARLEVERAFRVDHPAQRQSDHARTRERHEVARHDHAGVGERATAVALGRRALDDRHAMSAARARVCDAQAHDAAADDGDMAIHDLSAASLALGSSPRARGDGRGKGMMPKRSGSASSKNSVDSAVMYALPVIRGSTRASSPIAYDASNTVPMTLRSEEHTSELQSRRDLVCRLLLEK